MLTVTTEGESGGFGVTSMVGTSDELALRW